MKYVTDDGMIFESELEAKIHDNELKLKELEEKEAEIEEKSKEMLERYKALFGDFEKNVEEYLYDIEKGVDDSRNRALKFMYEQEAKEREEESQN